MKTFKVTICESIGKDIKVQAENRDEAIEAVRQCYDEDQVLNVILLSLNTTTKFMSVLSIQHL
jgi:hypothetical protein